MAKTPKDVPLKPTQWRSTINIQPGKAIEVKDRVEVTEQWEMSPLCIAMADTFSAYRKAASGLLEGKYASVRELAPPNLRIPCHIWVFCCHDAVLVRYDAAGEEQPRVRAADHHESITELAPKLSDQMLHVPDDPALYVPNHTGPGIVQFSVNERGEPVEQARLHPVIFVSKTFPADFEFPPPSSRPPCLGSFNRELEIRMRGVATPSNAPPGAIAPPADHFVAYGVMSLPVGWQAIEIYPRLGPEFWRPEYASAWAELDLLTVITQRNATQNLLHQLDGRRATREHYRKLLEEFQTLLEGPEEPCHQFLKAHPQLLCPTHEAVWSKLKFGSHVSDFVFREPGNDYLLVEIEAPHRKLFREDGHPRQFLTHAISQIGDWLGYIQNNKTKVEHELGLSGISSTPRRLVVIGRSASLTGSNREKLTVMQGEQLNLTILTYDELIDRARTNLEHLLGPLSLQTQNLDVYFYRDDTGA